ncbi:MULTISPECIES: hypothetical protein [unclassified Streptomyces]|uniref:hypothetical protein n=1 Tax=unclassified Streptomyces TaxID=2593676 RepID=UPI0009397FDB|nr:hypothetical protein [Streptomyces sp. TSRI0281]OKI35182.1 hypothetical protein A6A29_16790 [Streptomyces sp. TSRI0281]
MAPRTRHAGTDWLATCAPDPAFVRRRWAGAQLAPIPVGRSWLVAETTLTRTMDAMERVGSDRLGPVLVHPEADLAWWLVPLDGDQELADVGVLTIRTEPWTLLCPPAHEYLNGCGWLENPDGSGRLTDPAALGAAFGPGGPLRLPVSEFV